MVRAFLLPENQRSAVSGQRSAVSGQRSAVSQDYIHSNYEQALNPACSYQHPVLYSGLPLLRLPSK